MFLLYFVVPLIDFYPLSPDKMKRFTLICNIPDPDPGNGKCLDPEYRIVVVMTTVGNR